MKAQGPYMSSIDNELTVSTTHQIWHSIVFKISDMLKVEAKVTSFCNWKDFATGIIYVTYEYSTIHTSGKYMVNVNVLFYNEVSHSLTGQGHDIFDMNRKYSDTKRIRVENIY